MQFPNHTYCQRALWGLLLPLVYLLGFGSTQAQAPAIFHDVSKGLSQNTVTSIAQDEQGFLWVGTRYGLNKYDGNSYQHFFHDSKDSNSLTVNTIEKLISGKNGILWIGTENGGLNKMHIPSGKITSFTIDNSTIKSNYIRTFYLDEQGLLYIAGDNTGLDIFDTKTETFLRAEQHPLIKSMEGEDISAIHGNTTGVFVIGTIQRGVFYYNAITNRLDHHPEVAAQVNAVADAGISDFVIGTNQGIYLGEVIQNSLTIRKPNYPTINQSVILSLETEGDGTIWVGTENDGLGKIDPDRKLQTYSANVDQDGINGNSIWSIFQDHSGRIWMGYYLKGISKIDALEEKFRKISVVDVGSQKVSLNLVNAFASPNDSVVWIGLEEVGLIEWNRKTNAFQSIDAFWEQGSDRVVTALMYAKGNLWIGTWNEGLIKYNVENRSFQKFSRAAGNLIGDKILRIFKDKTERIWVSVQDEGLQLFDQELGFQQAYTKGTGPNQIANVRIRFLTEDCDGNILLGSERGGLVKLYLEGTNIVRQESLISEKDEINDDISTNCLLVDSECNLWIGTEGLGLFLLKYDQPQPIQFTMEQGLPSNRICALEQDKKGDIWGSLNDGLFSFDAKENTFYHYSIEDGLVSNEFEVGASYKLRDGTIFFGATSGINYFVPIEIPFNDTPPEPYITHIYISNQEFATKQGLLKPAHYNGQQITTRFKENDISFGFTGLNLTQGKLNKFQHKLEGFDEDWSPISNKRIAEYANIPYGKYTFVLRAANNDGVWSSVHPQVFLHVKTPWYSTYLAWAIYILVAGTIIFVIQKSIINQINLRNELAMEHIEVSKLKELDKLKSKFFANISHEFLTPLTLILTPLKGIQSRGNNQISDQTVETIINNANRLQKFIKQILALAKLETGNVKLRIDEHDLSPWLKTITNNFRSIASDKSMTFRVEIPDRKVLAFYDEDRLEQVLVNLLSNAFKYTDNQGLVNLKLREEKDQISISIEDTGQGIPKEDVENIFNRFYRQKNENIISGTGIGLSITKQIIIQHDATIAVNSTPGKGSTFTVVLKKGKDHFVDNPTVEFVYNEPST
ncbi:MAG: two-component regulator propeller domain-containing protein [Bacteroidota bacterium]